MKKEDLKPGVNWVRLAFSFLRMMVVVNDVTNIQHC